MLTKIIDMEITGIFNNKIAEFYVLNPWQDKNYVCGKKTI